MSLDTFIPQVWSARLLESMRKALVYAQPGIINRDYEGEIAQLGDTVRINAIGPVTVSDYGKNSNMTAAETLKSSDTVLTISQSKYFNFQIDDVDRAQQSPKVMDAAMAEAAYALADTADQYVAGLWTQVAKSTTNGAAGSGINVGYGTGDTKPWNALLDLGRKLDEQNIPRTAGLRWAIVPPWFHAYLLMDTRFTSTGTPGSDERLANGFVGQAAGFRILLSNNVPSKDANDEYKILAGTDRAITFADQVSEIEAYRPELRFADAVKGLHLYGAKVIRPNGLALLIGDIGTAA